MKKFIKKIIPQVIIDLFFSITTSIYAKCLYFRFGNLVVRKNETDSKVLRSIFVRNELKLPIDKEPKFIVDGGAYTGYSSLYYHMKYPKAKIIAVEPADSNFNVLKENTEMISSIERVKAALWSSDSSLEIMDRHTGDWGFTVKESAEGKDYDVKGVTIIDLLNESRFQYIDLLKLDIEGAEKEIFSKNYHGWINKVNSIVVELHDRIQEGCTESLYSAINLDEWDEYRNGEKVILVRKVWKNQK